MVKTSYHTSKLVVNGLHNKITVSLVPLSK